jgi:hypothetical protein
VLGEWFSWFPYRGEKHGTTRDLEEVADVCSGEQSILWYAENTVIPIQVSTYSPKGTNHAVELLFGSSLYDLKQADRPVAADVAVRNGLRFFSPAAALVKVPEAFFSRNPIETQVAL